jgi:hypothetical protein
MFFVTGPKGSKTFAIPAQGTSQMLYRMSTKTLHLHNDTENKCGVLRTSHLHQRPDDGGSKYLWNVGKLLPDYTTLQPRRQPSSFSTPWEPQIKRKVKRAAHFCSSRGTTLFLGASFGKQWSRITLRRILRKQSWSMWTGFMYPASMNAGILVCLSCWLRFSSACPADWGSRLLVLLTEVLVYLSCWLRFSSACPADWGSRLLALLTEVLVCLSCWLRCSSACPADWDSRLLVLLTEVLVCLSCWLRFSSACPADWGSRLLALLTEVLVCLSCWLRFSSTCPADWGSRLLVLLTEVLVCLPRWLRFSSACPADWGSRPLPCWLRFSSSRPADWGFGDFPQSCKITSLVWPLHWSPYSHYWYIIYA